MGMLALFNVMTPLFIENAHLSIRHDI